MPQLQNVVLTDRKSTPVDHTFTPLDISGGVGTVVESSGIPVGQNRLTISQRVSNGRYRPSLRLQLPVVQNQTINGVSTPVVVRTAYVEVNFTFDQTSSIDERKDAVGMIASALQSDKTLINDTVVNLQGVY
jgi:hypothetical protein